MRVLYARQWARFVLGWVTYVEIQLPVREIYLGLTNHPCQLSLAIPPWVGTMSTGQRAMMLCGWRIKASMARVWWQAKLCGPLYNTSRISAL